MLSDQLVSLWGQYQLARTRWGDDDPRTQAAKLNYDLASSLEGNQGNKTTHNYAIAGGLLLTLLLAKVLSRRG